MERFNEWIQKIERFSLVLCMTAIVFLMALQVVTRYLVVLPAPWSAEMGSFSLVWMVFLGAAAAAHRNRHVRVESIFSRLPDMARYLVQIGIYIGILLMLAIIVYYGFIRAFMSTGSILPATRLPMTTIMISVPIGALLMMIHYLSALYNHIRSKPGGSTP